MAFTKHYTACVILLLTASCAVEGSGGDYPEIVLTGGGDVGIGNTSTTYLSVADNGTIKGLMSVRIQPPVLIGSFNMKQFGTKKANNEQVLKVISKIIRRYDVIALQEITDVKQVAIDQLIRAVNEETKELYSYVISSRVGRSKQKEQYALFYRRSVFILEEALEYLEEPGQDPFSREPHICKLKMKSWGQTFVIANIHTVPTNAPAEIESLADVHQWIENRMGTKDIIILGDFNADCQYLHNDDLRNIRLLNNPKFKWLIPNDFDTTVSPTDCAYDRIVISGPYLSRSWVPGSAKVFRFDKTYGLNSEQALAVSDHFPVEFRLREEHPVPRGLRSSSSHRLVIDCMSFGVVLALSNLIFGLVNL